MKKFNFCLVALPILILSCGSPIEQSVDGTDENYVIKVIDSCEYIEYDHGIFDQRVYSLTHKGNCKFCEARRSKK